MTAAPLDKRLGLLERRVTPLEAKVERLETWAGPGQNMSFSDGLAELRKKFDEFGKVQANHTKMLTTLTGDVAGLKTDVIGLQTDVAVLKADMTEVKFDVATLNSDMIQVKGDVAALKTDMAEVKADVAGLKTDMVEVKGTLGEILDRLPPRRETPGA
jgi:phage-related protein